MNKLNIKIHFTALKPLPCGIFCVHFKCPYPYEIASFYKICVFSNCLPSGHYAQPQNGIKWLNRHGDCAGFFPHSLPL